MTDTECLQLLGVVGKPTKTAVKKAFRLAALQFHPDIQGSDKEFIRLRAAYDQLIALKSDELARLEVVSVVGSKYDPFVDLNYSKRQFFIPDNPATEGFERGLRARGCSHCRGMGYITKNTDPARGFMGRERRLCRCQWA